MPLPSRSTKESCGEGRRVDRATRNDGRKELELELEGGTEGRKEGGRTQVRGKAVKLHTLLSLDLRQSGHKHARVGRCC